MKKILIPLFLFLALGFFIWQGIYLPKDSHSSKEVLFTIVQGEGTEEIASNLGNQGLIKSTLLFRLYTLAKGVSGRLQAGTYLLSPSMNTPEITQKFASGEVVKTEATIPEGFTLGQIEEKVGFNLKSQKLKSYKDRYVFLNDAPDEATLEGYLFPDTYQFSYGAILEEVVGKMLDNFGRKLTEDLREGVQRRGKTIFEIVTMASLLEKEVKALEDREIVSGILWKRLRKGIPLQVDATITYITGQKTTKVSKEDTQIDSLYNTYKYYGLPQGPISNPGLESILAAVYPKESPHFYYLSTPEGETIFSKTLEEHNLAKAKYLK